MLKLHRKVEDEEGWSLTLADMMTLILCFFVVIAAIARPDRQALDSVAKSMQTAMKGEAASQAAGGVRGPDAGRRLFDLQVELVRLLKSDREIVAVKLRPDAVLVELPGDVSFVSGSADLTEAARGVLGRLAPALAGIGHPVAVEGHTDDVPISSVRFPSNWELSAARAAAVARLLMERGVEPQRLTVIGLADTRPLASNRDAAGKALAAGQARNRRVAILVRLPDA